MEFEWGEKKADRNLRKHGVDFNEAIRVFFDPFNIQETDPCDHETRKRIIGESEGRILFVVYAERHAAIRLISARSASRQERSRYEENKGREYR